jgi:nucleoside-diphosphate-sugar epimerase
MLDVLVTGVEGFLGKEVALFLKNRNYHFVGVARKTQSKSYISTDLSDPKNVLGLLTKTKPRVIINIAASVNFQTDKPDLLFAVNALLPALLANYCYENDAHLIHCSSIIVHGFKHSLYNQHTELYPDTAYGQTKLIADNSIMASGSDASVFRFGGIFGKNGPDHLSINKTIDNALNRVPPRVVGTGRAKRNYVFVKDAARAIIDCIENKILGVRYIGGEINTIERMAREICEVILPGKSPLYVSGDEARDQIVENDRDYEITSFKEALKQML